MAKDGEGGVCTVIFVSPRSSDFSETHTKQLANQNNKSSRYIYILQLFAFCLHCTLLTD